MEYSVVEGYRLQHDPIGSKQLIATPKCKALRHQSKNVFEEWFLVLIVQFISYILFFAITELVKRCNIQRIHVKSGNVS